jgi:hypothetical protein
VLKEAEEALSAQSLPSARREELKAVGDGCRCVLEDLDKLVKKYESLGTQSRRTWDRMKFGCKDISALRLRLVSNTGLLNGLLTALMRSVHVFRIPIVLTERLMPYLRPMSRGSLTNFCKSFGKETEKAQLYRTKLLNHSPWTRKKSGVLFEKNLKISV